MNSAGVRLLSLFLLLLATSHLLSGAEEKRAPAPFALKIENGTVDVHAPDGRLLQSLPYAGDEPDDRNRDFFVFARDMDFDGHPDIAVLFSQGMQNIYYDCWLWREETGAFVKYEEFNEVANLDFDPGRKRVVSFTHVSATDNITAEYAWKGGELVLMEQTIQEFSPESETFSIRRFARDAGGEMRLVEEKTLSSEEFYGEAPDDWEPEAPEITGRNLIISGLPDESLPLDVMTLHGGEWWLRQRLDDRPMLLESRRLPAAEFDEGMPERLIALEWPLAREITVGPFPELAEKLAYPAVKAEFTDGENEDAHQFVAALVFTDDWSFWFVLEVPADAEPLLADLEASADAGTPNTMLRREMEKILLGIEAVGPADGDFLPGPGLPVYGTGAAMPDSPSLMDALIRIKKLVGPEEQSHWEGAGRLAYRHDGSGEVDGFMALLLSFGGDSREMFTAERHFAVNGAGAVYEMNVVDGPEYRRWDERLPMWAGQFRNGGILFEISMYREGPMGFYFSGLFSGDGIAKKEVMAVVEGRNASGDGLIFALDPADSAVVVSLDETDAVVGAKKVLERLVGRYVGRGESDAQFAGVWRAMDGMTGGECYALRDDGTFVHTSSENGALERELRKTGTWSVMDGELRLMVGARWILPVGDIQGINLSDELHIADGEVLKRLYNPPEAEIHRIAQVGADAEPGRTAVTIDDVPFYASNDQPGFVDTGEN